MDITKSSILLVDDDEYNLNQLTAILKPDYIVRAVTNGEAGIRAAEKFLPDLILLDVLMDDMTGFEVISILKETEATYKIPVIFITGLTNDEDEEKGFALGAVDYITKPFSPAVVRMRVMSQIKLLNQTRMIIDKEVREKSNRVKMEFLSRMSHEMRTPMNAIMGMTTLALRESDIGLIKDYLRTIDDSSRDLLRLIDSVFGIAAIEDDKITPDDLDFDINKLLQEILDQNK